MDTKPSGNKVLKTTLLIIGSIVILGLFGFAGYFFVSALPAFYATPRTANRTEWNTLPNPLVVNGHWRSWTTAKAVNDAVWTNDLVWMATEGGVVVRNLTNGEWVKFLPEHGLPSGNITAITADRSGRIWIGTTDSGLASYDGTSWTSYRGRDQIPSDQINDLYAASDGVIWAATAEGVLRFDGTAWSSVRFSLFDISPPFATRIAGNGNDIWVGTREGVYLFDGREWAYFSLNEGVINEDIYDISITPNGFVWVATPSGIGQFDGARWSRFTVKDGLPDLPATQLLAAPDNSVWITFVDQTNPELTQTVRFDGFSPTVVYEGPVNRLIHQGGELWVASATGFVQPRAGSIVDQIRWDEDMPHSILTGFARTEQGLAVSGDQGVSVYSQSQDDWSSFIVDPATALTLADDGRIAISSDFPADGVTLLDLEGNLEKFECRTAGMKVGRLYAMTETKSGALWFLGNQTIGRLQDGEWSYFPDGLPADFSPRKIVADSAGNVWIGLDVGLYRFNVEQARWEATDGRTVQRMTASVDGNLWLVMENQLIHLIDGEFRAINNPPLDDVSSGFVANEEGLWISSANGIAQLIPNSGGEWVIHTIDDGLSTNDVTTLTVDPNGQLWVGYGDPRFGFSVYRNGEWEFVHNIIDPNAVNGGHLSENAPRRNEVVGMGVTADETIWYGTYFSDLGRVSADELLYQPNDYRLYFEGITKVHSANDGSIWIAGWEGRLAQLLPESQVQAGQDPWLFYQRELSTSHVQALVVKDGKAWLGTDNGVAVIEDGICRMIPHRETLDVVSGSISPDGNSIWWATRNSGGLELDLASEKLDWTILHLRGRTFSDLTRAADDALWFVSDYELVRVDGENRRVVELEDFNSVSAVATGLDLRPWIATDQGIATLSGDSWQMLSTADGLLSNQVLDMLIDPDGTIWILTKSGISQYKP